MKKLISFLLVMFMIIFFLLPVTYCKSYESSQAAVEDANKFLKNNFGIVNYYKTLNQGW